MLESSTTLSSLLSSMKEETGIFIVVDMWHNKEDVSPAFFTKQVYWISVHGTKMMTLITFAVIIKFCTWLARFNRLERSMLWDTLMNFRYSVSYFFPRHLGFPVCRDAAAYLPPWRTVFAPHFWKVRSRTWWCRLQKTLMSFSAKKLSFIPLPILPYQCCWPYVYA